MGNKVKPYYKKNIGRYCQFAKCKETAYLSDIGYVVYGQTLCEKHARQECMKLNVEFPDPGQLDVSQLEMFDFLKQHLRLEKRESGGCPEENFPADCDVYLVLAGHVISEIRLG